MVAFFITGWEVKETMLYLYLEDGSTRFVKGNLHEDYQLKGEPAVSFTDDKVFYFDDRGDMRSQKRDYLSFDFRTDNLDDNPIYMEICEWKE